jgi:hypothetical protein
LRRGEDLSVSVSNSMLELVESGRSKGCRVNRSIFEGGGRWSEREMDMKEKDAAADQYGLVFRSRIGAGAGDDVFVRSHREGMEGMEGMESSRIMDLCNICFDQRNDAVLMECGHSGLCFQCAIRLFFSTAECPLCREVFLLPSAFFL